MQQSPHHAQTTAPDDAWRRIVDSALDDAVISCDEDGCVTTWSEGARRMFGWSQAEMLGQPLSRLFSPEDVASGLVERERDEARAVGRVQAERWHVRRDGSRFWAAGELRRLGASAGQAPGFVKVLRDRTHQRREDRARAQLAADLEFLASASEELADIQDLDAALGRIARLAVPGFADWCAVDLLDGDELRRVATAHHDPATLAQALSAQSRMPGEPPGSGIVREVLRSGRARLLADVDAAEPTLELAQQTREAVQALGIRSAIVAPIASHGEGLGTLLFASAESGRRYGAEDLSLAVDLARRAAVAIENARLLRALREADRAKDVFLATLAHELRNPLAPIWHGLTIIKRTAGEPERVEAVIGVMERQVGQLTRLVDDLLDVSRINAGKLELKKEPTPLVRVINTAVEMSRPHLEAAQHKLTLAFPEQPAEVMADPARLAQVFANLLNNAAKYTRHGGHVEVLVEARAAEVAVRVRDNGIGISPEMLSRVFGLFTQVEQAEARRQGGLGIGLSLVDGLVRLHGGRVEAHSDGPDRGSEFVVVLPRLVRAPLVPQEDPATQRKSGHGPARRVLVVDDNLDAAQTVAELLRMTGNEVAVAHDGSAAVQHTAEFRPDVVLLDIGLPDISGYEVARRIRQLPGVRQPTLIALTGWGQQQDKQQAAEAGFDQHWTKPVDPSRLVALAGRDS